jgi:hypothetical protein
VAALTFLAWLVFGALAAGGPGAELRAGQRGGGADHRLPVRDGAGDADLDHGRHRARGEMGVLFRKGDALQLLRDAEVVAVDKTGTLTVGKPQLTDLVVAEGFERAEVLALVAAVERRSEHPIAEAIVAAARAEGLALPTRRKASRPTPAWRERDGGGRQVSRSAPTA